MDEAYIEFSDAASLAADAAITDNLVVLRTLSKAYALAGARCGAVIGSAAMIALLSRVVSPYSFSTPVLQRVEAAFGSGQLDNTRRLIAEIVTQRDYLFHELSRLRVTNHVWPSQANFVLVRFHSLDKVLRHLSKDGILIRGFAGEPALLDCARITVGSAEEMGQLIASLAVLGNSRG